MQLRILPSLLKLIQGYPTIAISIDDLHAFVHHRVQYFAVNGVSVYRHASIE
jgi:hypothetical protein